MTIPETPTPPPGAWPPPSAEQLYPPTQQQAPAAPPAPPYAPMAPSAAPTAPGAQYAAAAPFAAAPSSGLWPKPARPIRSIVTIVLLSLGLAAAVVFIVLYVLELNEANARIREQNEQLDEQQELIDKKETFGAAMEKLLDTAGQLDGTLYGTIVPTSSYELSAKRAWTHRWDADRLDNDIENVTEATVELEELIEAAASEASTNGTGSVYESVTDALGGGYVASLLEDADTFCGSDVLACVDSADPYTVHFDAADNNVEYTNDFIRTGVAYHEFAHVLQMTNPDATDTALVSFGGNSETMADCFALTFLNGWTLDHRIWVSSYMYYDVSIGYGYTCNEAQRQVVRDWYAQLGYRNEPISQ